MFPDISEHQGAVDWNALGSAYSAGAIEAVAIRAGFGTVRADFQFATNQSECRARGIPAIYYWFNYPDTNSPEAEASVFNSVVGPLHTAEAMCGDFEDDGPHLFPRGQAGANWARAFLSALQAPQNATWWYTYPFLLSVIPFQQLYGTWPFWLADYGATPDSAFGQAMARQFTDCGSTPGVSGCSDQSRVLKPPLSQWLTGEAQPQPNPAPQPTYWRKRMEFDGTWNGNQNIFRIEPNGNLVHSWSPGSGAWNQEVLGVGYVPGALTVGHTQGQIHLLALQPDGVCAHFWQSAGGGTWDVEHIAAA
jgi:GH25 family lysozyme M1 (1,4-beta-N-acetylmuramidase)